MTRLLGILVLLLVPVLAPAAPTLNFDNPTVDGGTVSYDGAGGSLLATGVIFQQVIGVGTPQNSGTELFCYPVDCTLTFATGPNLTEGPPSYTFAGGGSLTLTGGLNTQDNGGGVQVVAAGSALAFGGVFANPSVVLGGDSPDLLFVGAGDDFKHADLAAFYGLDPGLPFEFANTELSLGGAIVDPLTHGFTATVSDADFANAAVPEPGTLLLLGSGLVGLVALKRRYLA